MKKTTEELVQEVDELRNELKQMKEIVGMLFNMVVDSEEDDDDIPDRIKVNTIDSPRFNT